MSKQERQNRGWLRMGELAKRLGLPVTTLRHYTDIGLLPVAAETEAGYRLFDYKIVEERIRQIRQVAGVRPTLKEAKALIESGPQGE
jgi:DNA-binding transcriptional MerR regulator